jgi:hypothetical protein
VSRRVVLSAARFVTNHGGFGDMCRSPTMSERGNGANGPFSTVFCGLIGALVAGLVFKVVFEKEEEARPPVTGR